jgi:hypothetical protein
VLNVKPIVGEFLEMGCPAGERKVEFSLFLVVHTSQTVNSAMPLEVPLNPGEKNAQDFRVEAANDASTGEGVAVTGKGFADTNEGE